jgi:hypothetical protein
MTAPRRGRCLKPAPAYRTAGVEAQCPAGDTPEVMPVTPPALRGLAQGRFAGGPAHG